MRTLEDGRTFTPIDRRRSSTEYRESFPAAAGIDVEVGVVGEHLSGGDENSVRPSGVMQANVAALVSRLGIRSMPHATLDIARP